VLLLLPQGLLADKPAILLVGGGEGMGKLKATVEELDARLQGDAQVRQQSSSNSNSRCSGGGSRRCLQCKLVERWMHARRGMHRSAHGRSLLCSKCL
jgi:UDP-N-acetylglucosamine:LPS N-acetylglucosamine transferase